MRNATWIKMLLLVCALGLFAGCATTPGAAHHGNADKAAELTAKAKAAQEAGNLQEAMMLFEQALALDPRNTDAYIGVGDVNQVSGDYAKAATQYEKARAIAPENFDANYKLALMYHLLNRLREAISTYLSALSIDPSNFDANLNLATAYLQVNQPQLGLPYAQRAVELNPDSVPALVNLGSIYSALDDHESALKAYESAMQHEDVSTPVAINYVNALLKTDHADKAVQVLRKIVAKDPKGEYFERLGYALYKTNDYAGSAEAYEQALAKNENDTSALNGLGVNLMTTYIQNDRKQITLRNRAVDMWRKSIRLSPDQPRILDLISRYSRL